MGQKEYKRGEGCTMMLLQKEKGRRISRHVGGVNNLNEAESFRGKCVPFDGVCGTWRREELTKLKGNNLDSQV